MSQINDCFDSVKFKYIKDSSAVLKYDEEGRLCQCCGEKVKIFSDMGINSQELVEILCPKCIASGEASKKFDGYFYDLSDNLIENTEAVEELEKRTPILNTWKEIKWPVCCDDYCVFQKEITTKDLDDRKFVNEVRKNYQKQSDNEKISNVIEEIDDDGTTFLLFKCGKCGKYFIIKDDDDFKEN